MRLLGWMHRKFKQNNGEPLKDFVIGQAASDEQQYFPRTSINKLPFKQAQRGLDDHHQEYYDEQLDESLVSISEIFPGFLAIGTLGSPDPPTPKFSISIDHITERSETEVTESELKLINEELEKVLEAEAKDADGGSRRDSHVSMGRSSVTDLSGKVLEGGSGDNNVNNNGTGAVVCPLQGYLFGSAVELSETTRTMAKKENRTSLGELFQRSKMCDQEGKCEKDCDEKELGDHNKYGNYGMQLIKKKLKKKMTSTAAAAPGVLEVSSQTKLHKILHLFNRKVYPESAIMGKEKWDQKAQKNDKKKLKTTIDHKNNGSERISSTEEDIMIFPKKLIFKKTTTQYKTHSTPPHFLDDDVDVDLDDDDDADSNWNKEQWIKTDADYLVLEL